jgi:hypothetical protein
MQTVTLREHLFYKRYNEKDYNEYIIKHDDGSIEYIKNGTTHRADGPAFIQSNGFKYWFFEGKLHRIDGPAVECTNGSVAYWYNGVRVTKEAIELLQMALKIKKVCK